MLEVHIAGDNSKYIIFVYYSGIWFIRFELSMVFIFFILKKRLHFRKQKKKWSLVLVLDV